MRQIGFYFLFILSFVNRDIWGMKAEEKVNLEKDVLPHIVQGLSVDRKCLPVACCKVKVIDPAFHGAAQCPDGFRHPGTEHVGGADSDLANTVSCFSVDSVFHYDSFSSFQTSFASLNTAQPFGHPTYMVACVIIAAISSFVTPCIFAF